MTEDKCIRENLYLSKGNEEIYVPTYRENGYKQYQLAEHQMAGIRFMYKQFKKKKPGIIMNDPRGYGKTLQVVLFINAIRHLLDKSILILSDHGDKWLSNFQTWSDFGEDIFFFWDHPSKSKKGVHINVMNNHWDSRWQHEHWSVVVVDNFKISYPTMKMKADFKICVTPNDLKGITKLNNFLRIYHWLYPVDHVNIRYFRPIKNDAEDIVLKSILLDAFVEDIIRRSDDPPAFKIHHPNEYCAIKSISKDVTGTKIKSSKRKQNGTSEETLSAKKLELVAINGVNILKKQPNSDVSSVKNSNSIKYYNTNKSDHNTKVKEEVEESSISDTDSFIYDEPTSSKDFDNVISRKRNVIALHCSNDRLVDSNLPANVLNVTLLNQSSIPNPIIVQTVVNILNKNLLMNENNINDKNDLSEITIKEETLDTEVACNNVEMITVKEEPLVAENADDIDMHETVNCMDGNIVKEEIDIVMNELDETVDSINVSMETGNVGNSELIEPLQETSDTVYVDKKAKSKKLNDIDTKVSVCEEMALKKFKGSLLDSLFKTP